VEDALAPTDGKLFNESADEVAVAVQPLLFVTVTV
jgi:hypothetical protein